jgi:tetratricopeptide (TPR) repeat protein
MRSRAGLPASLFLLLLLALPATGQVSKIMIPAGSPEDQALQSISNEQDPQKRTALYTEFVGKYASNPAAVAYGNWQISQFYLAAGDTAQALAYGDKAVAAMPDNLDVLASQVTVAQQMKDNAKILGYAAKGGAAFQGIGKQATPEGVSAEDFESHNNRTREDARSNYEYLEGAAYNAIAGETNGKKRMSYIEQYNAAFPDSRYRDQVTQFAIISLQQMNDRPGVVVFGEKALAANPDNVTTLLLLAETMAEDARTRPKSLEYARKAVALTKEGEASGDPQKELLAGSAHSVLGFVLTMHGNYGAAIPELRAATGPLKEQEAAESRVLYCLGLSYAKLRRYTEAQTYLTQAVGLPGPYQGEARKMLVQVNALRAKGQ